MKQTGGGANSGGLPPINGRLESADDNKLAYENPFKLPRYVLLYSSSLEMCHNALLCIRNVISSERICITV